MTMESMISKNPIVAAVQREALKHYEDSFEWSSIWECYTEQEILDELAEVNIFSPENAVKHFQDIVDARDGSDYSGKGSERW